MVPQDGDIPRGNVMPRILNRHKLAQSHGFFKENVLHAVYRQDWIVNYRAKNMMLETFQFGCYESPRVSCVRAKTITGSNLLGCSTTLLIIISLLFVLLFEIMQ